jgi:hypothetical protein
MVSIFVSTNEYKVNAQNAKEILSANTINEKQPVSPVLPLADASTAKQYPLSDPVGIPTAFVATVYYTQT